MPKVLVLKAQGCEVKNFDIFGPILTGKDHITSWMLPAENSQHAQKCLRRVLKAICQKSLLHLFQQCLAPCNRLLWGSHARGLKTPFELSLAFWGILAVLTLVPAGGVATQLESRKAYLPPNYFFCGP